MINIHTKLLELVPKYISPDEFFILLCITKRIGKKNAAWPSVQTLMNESGFGRNKVIASTNILVEKKMIEKIQRTNANGRFTSNLYKIKTKGIAVYIPAYEEILEELSLESDRVPEIKHGRAGFVDQSGNPSASRLPNAENPNAENQTISINQVGSINQDLEDARAREEFLPEEIGEDPVPPTQTQQPTSYPDFIPKYSTTPAIVINPMSYPSRAALEADLDYHQLNNQPYRVSAVNDPVLRKWGERVPPPPELRDGLDRDPDAIEKLKESNPKLYRMITEKIEQETKELQTV